MNVERIICNSANGKLTEDEKPGCWLRLAILSGLESLNQKEKPSMSTI